MAKKKIEVEHCAVGAFALVLIVAFIMMLVHFSLTEGLSGEIKQLKDDKVQLSGSLNTCNNGLYVCEESLSSCELSSANASTELNNCMQELNQCYLDLNTNEAPVNSTTNVSDNDSLYGINVPLSYYVPIGVLLVPATIFSFGASLFSIKFIIKPGKNAWLRLLAFICSIVGVIMGGCSIILLLIIIQKVLF